MSAKDLKPENIQRWLAYAARKRAQAGEFGLAQCEHGHYDCAPVWNGTCPIEVQKLLGK